MHWARQVIIYVYFIASGTVLKIAATSSGCPIDVLDVISAGELVVKLNDMGGIFFGAIKEMAA